MKKLLIFTFFLLITIFTLINHFSQKQTIFVMLNVDKTILDRVFPYKKKDLTNYKKLGFAHQILEFEADKEHSAKFLKLYSQIAKGDYSSQGSSYMNKITARKIADEKFIVQECVVVRPAIKSLLDSLKNLGTSVKILLTSRNDDARTKNLHEKLNLKIDGKNFTEATTFIPRDCFRLKPENDENTKSVKSAALLRKKYTLIKPKDIVVLLDHIDKSRFIKGETHRDFRIFVPKFTASDKYNKEVDLDEMNKILLEIKKIRHECYH